MMKVLFTSLRQSLSILVLILLSSNSYASHIFGADFYYTWVSGNTYQFTVVAYGDCAGSAFSGLPSSSPRIVIYNGTSAVDSFNLTIQSPTSGVEVTPVCSAYKDSTQCTNTSFPIPGVKKFVYQGSRTLSGTSANWKFFWNGTMGAGPSAGRSATIGNISSPGTSITGLIATLNNTGGHNSSSQYTTIPTPFFCINEAANYNPGAVDPDNDSLSFGLVKGIDASLGINGTVTYTGSYSATAPLATSAGTFVFGSATGQVSFTPNALQHSLMVERDTEFRSGTIVGTSMREMVIVVLNCNNPPPRGAIDSASAGTKIDSTDFKICHSADSFSFVINPFSPDSAKITVTAAGLPAGSHYNVANNGTKHPRGIFTWKITNVLPGNYTFFLTFQDSACPLSSKQTQAYTITILPDPTITYQLLSAAKCTKKAVFKATPGVGSPWTYAVIQGSTTVHSSTGVTGAVTDSLSPGTYTLRFTNTNGCFHDTSITIASPPKVQANISLDTPTCVGSSDGSITVTGTVSGPPFLYGIGGGGLSSTNTFGSLTAGTYTIHVKDSNNCTLDTNVNLANPNPILANITFTKPPCNHYNTGSISVTGYNSTGPYTYALGAGSYGTSGTFTGLFSGSYTVHIKNALGCVKDTVVNVPDSVKINATLALTDILCNGDSTGAIAVSATGAYGPPFTYALGSGSFGSTSTFTSLGAGTYTVHVQDTEQCHWDSTISLTQPNLLVPGHTATNVDCHGNGDGKIVETASGGTTTYTYNINGGSYSGSGTFTNLTPGTYVIGVKDANGCIKYDTIIITEPPVLAITALSSVSPTCNGGSDGSYTITASGGTSPYTYAADGGSYGSGSTVGGLSAGSHTLHVKDANACIKDTSVSLTQPPPIVPSAQVAMSTCKTLANGKVILSATGGTPGYTYAVGSGSYSSSATFTPLAAGTYTFHIKDAHSCIKDTSITIPDSLRISSTSFVSNALCYNQNSGYIVENPAGGTNPYTYAIGSGAYQSNDTLKSLLAGTYTIHVKDNNGCINDTNVTVGQPTNILPAATITKPSCFGYSDGSVSLSASGGTPGYTYANGSGSYSSSGTFTGLPIGTYTLHVKDNNGCIHDTSITVTQPTPLIYDSIKISNVKCFGDSSGFVIVYADGATPPYKYAANSNPFQASSTINNLKVGVQIIHLIDNNNCSHDTSVTLTQPTPLRIHVDTIKNPTCEGYKDGYVVVNGVGGTPEYMYAINSSAFDTLTLLDSLPEATYAVHVKDANGCTHDTALTLIGYPHIIVDNVNAKNAACFATRDGGISITASGGVQPLSYQLAGDLMPPKFLWDTTISQTFSIWDSLIAGKYIVIITDSKNCQKDTAVTITQPDKLELATTIKPNECVGPDTEGYVRVDVKGGTTPYAYLWSTNPPQTVPQVYQLENGKYMIWVTDANNCNDSTLAIVQYDDCCKPFIPSAFTPNGDGLNDIFRIRFKGDLYLQEFSVYNRYGTRVYYTNILDQGWDGTWNNVPQEVGTYFYYLKAICGNKQDHTIELKGDVTLIR
jgi:gliding motility-associated-like protein